MKMKNIEGGAYVIAAKPGSGIAGLTPDFFIPRQKEFAGRKVQLKNWVLGKSG